MLMINVEKIVTVNNFQKEICIFVVQKFFNLKMHQWMVFSGKVSGQSWFAMEESSGKSIRRKILVTYLRFSTFSRLLFLKIW